ncbi:MAG: phosphoribosylglycinamide formyltransferase [Rhizobiaceae bacterium]|nr:phosphoribosylglycinamide formyltransferase [Rhizobiaceae bacterium]
MSRTAKRVVILISGRGSNMAALIDAAAEKDYPAEIVGVISDKADAAGLTHAASKGIPVKALERRSFGSKDAHDQAIDATIHGFGGEIVCLAGYMRLLTPRLVTEWAGRMINIHPALLPLFKGLDTHRLALESGVRLHGCTVHFVTPEMDSGPIIAQAAVPVLPDDTEEVLAQRVLKAEHKLYPLALELLAQGGVGMKDGKAIFRSASPFVSPEARLFSLAPHSAEVDVEALARFTP